MKVLWAYAVYQWKRAFRTPVTLTWTFILPTMWLLLFAKTRLCAPLGVITCGAGTSGSLTEAYASFLTMGIIGLNALSIGLFGVGVVLVQMREQGILRRLALTPQPAWKFVGGHLLASGVIMAASTLLLLLVAALAFRVQLPLRLVEWCLVLGIGAVTCFNLGCALAGLMHDVRTVQVVGNVVFLICTFLSGVWFPLGALPQHLQWLSLALPLSHFLKMLRSVGCHGQPLSTQLVSLAIVCVWGAGGGWVAIRHFRRQDGFPT